MSDHKLIIQCNKCDGSRTWRGDDGMVECDRCHGRGELYDEEAEDSMLITMASVRSGIMLTTGERAVLLNFNPVNKEVKVRVNAEYRRLHKSNIKGVKFP